MKNRVYAAPLLLLAGLAACDGDSTGDGGSNITSVEVRPLRQVVSVNGTYDFAARTRGADGATDADVSWRSLDPGIATVDGDGLARGVSAGTARIVASESGFEDTATVRVTTNQVLPINVSASSFCDVADATNAEVKFTGQRIVFLEDGRNPVGGLTDTEYKALADRFDQLVWPINNENFGTPTDLDGNARVYAIFTKSVNELTPSGSNGVVGGFFWVRDLLSKQANATQGAGCATSNEAEIFYLLAPDEDGEINGNRRPRTYVAGSSFGTITHEFQHLINAGRRLYVNGATGLETVWLDEGISHMAEELAFYAASGMQPRQNLAPGMFSDAQEAAFFEFQDQNFYRLEDYYENPTSYSAIQNDDALAIRGATWGFLRYAADRRGGNEADFWRGLVNNKATGIQNLNAQLSGNAMSWLGDWVTAIYADDAVPGVAAAYRQPSWNFRTMMPALRQDKSFPLAARTLANGTPANLSLSNGTGAFIRFGVAPAARAEIRTTSGGGTVTGACASGGPALDLAVGQVHTATPATASVICINGGATGGDFVFIPFYANEQESTLAVEVAATGVVPPVGPPSPALLPSGTEWIQTRREPLRRDREWELRLRQSEREQLARMLRGGAHSASLETAQAQAPETLRISILRTR